LLSVLRRRIAASVLTSREIEKRYMAMFSGFERELIWTRTGEVRERAIARGVWMGRKPKLAPHQRKEALARRDAGEPLAEIGKSYAVSHSTISRLR
jgi:DNA invertase Pin-like site-specific DNA recombinase